MTSLSTASSPDSLGGTPPRAATGHISTVLITIVFNYASQAFTLANVSLVSSVGDFEITFTAWLEYQEKLFVSVGSVPWEIFIFYLEQEMKNYL